MINFSDCDQYYPSDVEASIGWYSYCKIYYDFDCNMGYFTLKWVPFLVIYIIMVILSVYYTCVCWKQTHTMLYLHANHEHELVVDTSPTKQNDNCNHTLDYQSMQSPTLNSKDSQHSTIKSKISTKFSKFRKQLYQWHSKKVNINAQMLMAVVNAIVSIIGTTTTLVSQSPNHGCQHERIRQRDNGDPYTQYYGMRGECSLSLITIGIGIFILFVLAFGCCVRKCKCACCGLADHRDQSRQHNDNSSLRDRCTHCCGVWVWSLMDDHLRFTILIKFIYFMLKPALVAITSTSSQDTDLIQTFETLYLILLLATTTALAYMTFDKRYKTITTLTNIMTNPSLFAKTYIISYSTSIIGTYTITFFVFALSSMKNGNHTTLICSLSQRFWLV